MLHCRGAHWTNLGSGGLVELGKVSETAGLDGIQQAQGAYSVRLRSVLGHLEGDLTDEDHHIKPHHSTTECQEEKT